MKTRFSRDARHRAKPMGARFVDNTTRHHGDEFDAFFPESGSLTIAPVRNYTPKVPQDWDIFSEGRKEDVIVRSNWLGPIFHGYEPVITSNADYDSFRAAFDKRSNSQPAKGDDCDSDFVEKALALWAAVDQQMRFDSFDYDEDIFERWLAKFDETKQRRMLSALDGLVDISDSVALGRKALFVKVEALLKRHDTKWAPRLIYQGTDAFNVLTGPIAMVLCERLKLIFDNMKLGPIKYLMAYKVDDVVLASFLEGSASDEAGEECFEADFSANDLNQRESVTYVFDRFCEAVCAPQWFRKLLIEMRTFTVENRDFGLTAKLENQLPTGTTITTARNTVWNATIESVFAQEQGNSGRATVLGDDFLGMFKHPVSNEIAEWVATKPKMKLTPAWPQLSGEATFLSRRICTYSDPPCMMPKFGKALARFNARASPNMAISDSAYMAGKALSYAYEFRHFPKLRELFMVRHRSEEDKAIISTEELSWFTKTSGIDTDSLEKLIYAEKHTVSDDSFREFMMDSYGDTFGLVDTMDIARRMILCGDRQRVDPPHELLIDLE